MITEKNIIKHPEQVIFPILTYFFAIIVNKFIQCERNTLKDLSSKFPPN